MHRRCKLRARLRVQYTQQAGRRRRAGQQGQQTFRQRTPGIGERFVLRCCRGESRRERRVQPLADRLLQLIAHRAADQPMQRTVDLRRATVGRRRWR